MSTICCRCICFSFHAAAAVAAAFADLAWAALDDDVSVLSKSRALHGVLQLCTDALAIATHLHREGEGSSGGGTLHSQNFALANRSLQL